MGNTVAKGFGLRQLVEASRRITTHLEMDRVLSQITDILTSELGASYSLVWIVERGDLCSDCEHTDDCLEQDECLHLKGWSAPRGKRGDAPIRLPLGVLKIGRIAQSKAPYLTNDVVSDPLLADPVWVREQGIVSFAGFPLVLGDRLLGVLAYYGDRPLEPELGDILSCFAHQSAIAIEDARQYERLRESEEHYRALLDGAIDAVLIFGPDGDILNCSRSASQLFGFKKETLLMMNVRDLDLASESKLSVFFKDIASGGAITYETAFRTKSGNYLPVEVRAGLAHYGGETAVQAYVRDVSERKKIERQKSDLISMITHDLKGPLSIIMGYAEVIKDQYAALLPEFVREGIDSISNSGEKLLSMINDYLSLSRMEAGVLPMVKSPVSLGIIANRALGTVLFRAEEKKLRLQTICPPDLPPVQADPKHLERAVANLLTNAVSYTPRGGSVTLSCRVDPVKESAEIAVTDTGMGISSEDLPKVFDKYYRCGKDSSKGVGLGLAIVKSVVEGHGGTVSVESELGAGSTFTLSLPLKK